MARLALSRDFLNDFASHEPRIRAKVQEHANTFDRLSAEQLRTLTGLHLERHKNSADPRARTIRIDRNHRGIVMDAGNNELFILMSIGTHDETDRWMAKNTFKVNAATGALEVMDVEGVRAQVESVVTNEAAEGLFDRAGRKDKDFIQLGIDAELIPALRAFTDEDQLLGVLPLLPQSQCDALIALTGEDSVQTIYAQIAGSETRLVVDTEDVVAALEAPASRAQFHVVDGQEELAEIFSQPGEHWKYYLHPSQQSIVEKETYNGPVRVTGGAGTGKTVVAIHRARLLADRLTDRNNKQILFTTFTRNLAQAIEQQLRAVGGSEVLDVIDVLNVDKLAHRIVQDAEGVSPRPISGKPLDSLIEEIVEGRGLEYSPGFVLNEWEQVVIAQGITDRTGYFRANRAGRGVPLDRRARAEVWKGIEELTRRLVDSNQRSYLQLADAAAGYVANRTVKPYLHVVVDEAQDLHEAQWRLLRAIVAEEANDMFIVGDSHQRIYDRRSSLSKVGINIRGRSKKLKINYRTTHEILGWSLALLGEASFDDLDGGEDPHDFAGYHSFRHGPRPILSGHESKKEQIDALVDQVRQWIADGTPEESIGVAARGQRSFDAVERALVNSGREVCILPTDLPRARGVRIGTMHRMKGLEFQRVAIVDVDDLTIPSPYAITSREDDPTQHAHDIKQEQCLLYVAATRARDGLWVGWSGKPSRFLGAVS